MALLFDAIHVDDVGDQAIFYLINRQFVGGFATGQAGHVVAADDLTGMLFP